MVRASGAAHRKAATTRDRLNALRKRAAAVVEDAEQTLSEQGRAAGHVTKPLTETAGTTARGFAKHTKRSRRRLAKNAKRTRKELLRETRHATREARQAARALRRIGQQAASNVATELHTRAGEAQTEVAKAARRTRHKTPRVRYRYWPWLVAAAIAAAAGIGYMMRHRSTPAATLHDESAPDSVKTGSDEADGDTSQPPPTVTVQADASRSE